MSNRTTLKRLEQLAQRHHSQPDDAQRRERERLDAMTDDELARNLAALERAVELLREGSPEFAAELDAAGL